MAKPSSNKKRQKSKKTPGPFKIAFKENFEKAREFVWSKKRARVRLHQSFKRSYREDYARKLEVPGLTHHAVDSFRLMFRNWKLFIPLIIFAVVFNVVLVGLMSEETYVTFQQALDNTNNAVMNGNAGNLAKAGLLLVSTITSGGFNSSLSEVQIVFAVISFLLIWLITIYLCRHLVAGKKVKLRDGFYNALTPLIATFVIFVVAFLQMIPIFVVVITYSAAVQTDFLSTPFYALVYFIFASLMILLSGYLLSSTLMALVAVTAPGLYPLAALRTASDIMAGRRIRFIIRLLFLIFIVALVWVIIMLPIIVTDMFLKAHISWMEGWPIVPIFLQIMTCFSFVYVSIYLYLYYRRVLAYEDDK